MADVYLAYQPDQDRQVALKVIHQVLANEPGFVDSFRREARTVASLDHTHIVRVYDSLELEADRTYCLVMEYIAGSNLADRLQMLAERNHTMPLDEVVRVISAICDALGYAHSLNMVHRDIKPSNIMFRPTPEADVPVLTDFGVAKIKDSSSLTNSNLLTVTPLYMSPEQAQGLPLDGRSDIYSLGIVLYELVTGRVPFEGESVVAIGLKHLTEPLPSPLLHNPALPQSFVEVIDRATQKSPGDRYSAMSEFAGALRAALVRQAGPADAGLAGVAEQVGVPDQMPPPGELVGAVELEVLHPNRERAERVLLPTDRPLHDLLYMLVKQLQANEVSPAGPPIAHSVHILDGDAVGPPLDVSKTLAELAVTARGTKIWLQSPMLKPALLGPGGRVFAIEQPVVLVGRPDLDRQPQIDLSELDADVVASRQHADIITESDRYVIRDRRATNGTFVNGEELGPGESRVLRDGDVVQFGYQGVELTFRLLPSH